MSRSRPVPSGQASLVLVVVVWWRLVTGILLAFYLVAMPTDATVYLNRWAVEIDGGPSVADAVAADYGFRNLGQV